MPTPDGLARQTEVVGEREREACKPAEQPERRAMYLFPPYIPVLVYRAALPAAVTWVCSGLRVHCKNAALYAAAFAFLWRLAPFFGRVWMVMSGAGGGEANERMGRDRMQKASRVQNCSRYYCVLDAFQEQSYSVRRRYIT